MVGTKERNAMSPLSTHAPQRYQVYSLVDPRDNRVYYVGQTANGLQFRLQDHLRRCHRDRTKKAAWLRELRAVGLEPEIETLEISSGSRAQAYVRESVWIRKLRGENHPLTN